MSLQLLTSEEIAVINAGLPKYTMVFDGGHNLIKGLRIGKENTTHSFPHALVRLTQAEYDEVLIQFGKDLPDDYILVNGAPYVYGESALSRIGLQRVTGPNRWTKDYMGVFCAIMAAYLFGQSIEIAVFASYPTGDSQYRDKLARAIGGKWTVERLGVAVEIKISYVNTYEEVVGGINNRVLSASGTAYLNADLNKGDVLAIDIGGGTTDGQSIRNGKVTDIVHFSIQRGVQNVEARFDKSFRAAHPELFPEVRQIPLHLIREAITTRKWDGGGKEIDCGFWVDEAIGLLINDIRTVYEQEAKGPSLWRYIVLTGGGAAMLEKYIRPILRHDRVILAHDDLASMHFANVMGGAKLWKLWKSKGWLA